jgi:hypothetical protein
MKPQVGDRIRFRETWMKEYPNERMGLGEYVYEVTEINEHKFRFKLIGTEKQWWDSLDNFDRTFMIGETIKPMYTYKRRTSVFKPR